MKEGYIKEVGDCYPLAEMEDWMRMGYYDLDNLVDIWANEILHPDDCCMDMEDEVEGIFDELFDELAVEQAQWPEETDFDRLEKVFGILGRRGIICTHHVGLEPWMLPGIDSQEYIHHHEKEKVVGCCYYYFSGMMGSIESGDGFYLRYDSINPYGDEAKMRHVGRMIQEALTAEGFQVKWSGSHRETIFIEDFVWQRRLG